MAGDHRCDTSVVNVALAGFGTVGVGVYELLQQRLNAVLRNTRHNEVRVTQILVTAEGLQRRLAEPAALREVLTAEDYRRFSEQVGTEKTSDAKNSNDLFTADAEHFVRNLFRVASNSDIDYMVVDGKAGEAEHRRTRSVDILIEVLGGADGTALQVVKTALENGIHVVTANKALVAKHMDWLSRALMLQ